MVAKTAALMERGTAASLVLRLVGQLAGSSDYVKVGRSVEKKAISTAVPSARVKAAWSAWTTVEHLAWQSADSKGPETAVQWEYWLAASSALTKVASMAALSESS